MPGVRVSLFEMGEQMITITERDDGHIHRYTYARDGQVMDMLTRVEAEALCQALAEALSPVSTAVSPAKARLMRYPVKASQ